MTNNVYSFISNKMRTTLTALVLIMGPVMTYAQAPNLGTAADFVLYTSNGQVLNTGITHLTGNVGTHVGPNSGFGNVDGVMHAANGTTLLAASDLQAGYTQITTTTNTGTLALLLGNGTTLNEGVYAIPGNASINNTLILDGQGDSSAVFIFKIAGALASGSGAQVSLVNGAQACNVFWTTEDVVSLGTNTLMKGTIIAHIAAINMASGTNLQGRALSIGGAITVDGITAHTPNGCGSAMLSGPLAPALGAAGCFAIFSSDGPVTDDGQSIVTGNIGTNLGSATLYDALNVTGSIYPGPNTFTAQAAGDLTTVANYLNGLTADITLLYPAQLGGGLVLTPHAYVMTQAAHLTDTLFLDAEGNTNAVFAIRINGALTTSTYAIVKLLNGAQATNVFWKVDGLVNLNNYSDFVGTVISDQAITLGMGSSIEGRALTAVGAINTATTTVTTVPGPCFPLSLNELNFDGKLVGQYAFLEWTTTSDMSNSIFTLEKSNDGKTFDAVTTKTDAAEHYYSFTDMIPYKYYRLEQKEENGKISYSRIISLNVTETNAAEANFYPNPFNSSLTVNVHDASVTNNKQLSVYNVLGMRVMNTTITQPSTAIKTDLPAGIYYYKLVDMQGNVQSGKLISTQ